MLSLNPSHNVNGEKNYNLIPLLEIFLLLVSSIIFNFDGLILFGTSVIRHKPVLASR